MRLRSASASTFKASKLAAASPPRLEQPRMQRAADEHSTDNDEGAAYHQRPV
jgi:hypothetical protein